jgi:hypothetical protein
MRKTTAIALITALALTQLSPPKAQAQGVLVIPEAAAIVIIGGIAYYVWTNSEGLREQVAVPSSSMPMIDNPDEQSSEEWDYIWADDYNQAVRRCREYVENNGGTYVRVVEKPGSTRYECHWTSN